MKRALAFAALMLVAVATATVAEQRDKFLRPVWAQPAKHEGAGLTFAGWRLPDGKNGPHHAGRILHDREVQWALDFVKQWEDLVASGEQSLADAQRKLKHAEETLTARRNGLAYAQKRLKEVRGW